MDVAGRRPFQGLAARLTAALIVLAWSAHRALGAQSAADPRFDALVALAEARMKEHGTP